jgi:hypothetical protein
VPPRSDLDAYFRVAWNDDFFFLLGDVYDQSFVVDGSGINQNCQEGGVLCEDAFTLFFDGRNNRTVSGFESYNIDDPRIFVSLGNKAFRISGAPVAPPHVDLKAVPNGPFCYRLEAQVAWSLIVGIQGDPGAFPDQFPPKPGNQYGFDVSVNDWDQAASDDTKNRESELFWVNPGADYGVKTTGFGAMTLVDQVSVAAEPQ